MIIENAFYRLSADRHRGWLELVQAWSRQLPPDTYPLRFAITGVTDGQAALEATLVKFDADAPYAAALRQIEIEAPRRRRHEAAPVGVVQVVPTGLRCEFGGYAGDACPVTNLLAAAADFLVTHPNAVNASDINEMADNVLYVEGKSLDDFMLGHVGLLPVRANRIGTFVDPSGIAFIDDVVNTLNAARAVKGIDCGLYAVLAEELGVRIGWSQSGCAVGTVLRPESLISAVEALLDRGAAAIGGVSVIHGVTAEMFSAHLRGEIPNPSGGVEAIITHLISKLFRVPAAHAPLPYYRDVKKKSTANPRASAEFISTPHYFCALKGLARAPRLVELEDAGRTPSSVRTIDNIAAVVLPAGCLGGIPALAAEYQGIPLIAVRENRSILRVDNRALQMPNVIEAESYLEAAGIVLALRQGIALDSLRRPIRTPAGIELPHRADHASTRPAATAAGRDPS